MVEGKWKNSVTSPSRTIDKILIYNLRREGVQVCHNPPPSFNSLDFLTIRSLPCSSLSSVLPLSLVTLSPLTLLPLLPLSNPLYKSSVSSLWGWSWM